MKYSELNPQQKKKKVKDFQKFINSISNKFWDDGGEIAKLLPEFMNDINKALNYIDDIGARLDETIG
jgi:uncharacterized protein YggL (DUF469 family)